MWDYKTGLPFQNLKDIPQPGSLDAEAVSRWSLSTLSDCDSLLTEIGSLLLKFRQDGYEADHGWSGQDDKGVFGTGVIVKNSQIRGACIGLPRLTLRE